MSAPTGDATVAALREALRHSPENVPLRRHLAETLLSLSRWAEAEKELRDLSAAAPTDRGLKRSLAECFARQSKTSHAMVIVEELLRQPDGPTHLLHARLLAEEGSTAAAIRAYRKAVEDDEKLQDLALATRLGIRADGSERDAPTLAGRDAGRDAAETADGRQRASWEGENAAPHIEIERPKVDFTGVGGMDALKDEIRIKIIHPLEHPELYKAYGKAIGGGILMYGPPGCGKTHLARATAGQIRAGFVSVGISDVLEMWIGNSERNLHELFDQARRNRPCVLFFDEVDALAASRADLRHSGGRQLINQFLSELDGVDASNDGVLILAATNAPWHLDPAFRRPGRFDRILFVPPPDAKARAEIVAILAKGKPTDGLDAAAVAKATEHFSGADLKAVFDLAIEGKLREAIKTGVPGPLSTKDLLAAVGRVRPSTREWFSTARNHALYANQGGVYDDILKYLKM